MNDKEIADVIIVGGGIIGNATAYYLSLTGRKVTVLEGSEFIGNGGSSRNGGGVRQSGRDKRELPIARWGIENIWPTLSEELGVDCEYYQQGNLRLGKTPEHMNILQGLADNAVSCGVDVKMVTGEEAREICPYLSEEVIGASWCKSDGHANPLTTTLGFYKRARELGAKFYTCAKVSKIIKQQGEVVGVKLETGEQFFGDKVLIASGLETRNIVKSVGIDLPMNPLLAEVLVTEAHEPLFYQMLGTAAADFYGHQSKHGSFVFGGFSGLEEFEQYPKNPQNTSATTSCAARGILGYFPILKNAKVVRTWAGWLDESADKVPVLSAVEEMPGLYLACGFSGHGFGIGPAVGKLLSQLIDDKNPEISLDALRYNRFKVKV